jgi:hypothetical protein
LTQLDKLYLRVASAPANARFEDVVRLAEAVGFVRTRIRGSHHIFRHGVRPTLRLNLQAERGKAKEYQVRALLSLIEREGLWR